MSEWKWESDSEVGEVAESKPVSQSVLTFFQRLLLGVNLWLAVGIFLIVALVMLLGALSLDSLRLWIFGLFLLGGSWNVGQWLWQVLNRGPFRAGMAVAFFFTFNVVLGSVVGLAGLHAASKNETLVERIQASWQKSTADDEALLKQESHLVYGIQSVGGPGSSQTGLQTCIEELHRDADRESMRDEAVNMLKRSVDESLAEDAVQDVILKVCLRFEDGKIQGRLRDYFFKSVNNKRADLWKRQIRDSTRYCEFDGKKHHKRWQDPSITDEEQLQLVQAAMCRINSRQAYIVRQRMDNTDYDRIARELDISEVYARKLYSLGLQSLREEMENLSR